jgi:hypothetical protein
MFNPEQLLTVEESQLVDGALLTSKEKFSARVAIYALRVLKAIAAERRIDLEDVGRPQVLHWLKTEPTIQAQFANSPMEVDGSFEDFWCQVLMSAIRPLNEAAEAAGVAVADLSPRQILDRFEQQSRQNLAGG